jgi:hypothetical protein
MKKFLGSFLITFLAANVAFAIVDPDTNSMGIYFDGNADIYELETHPLIEVMVYIILTNPDFGTLLGYEFGYQIVGNYVLVTYGLWGTGIIDVGGGPGNHIVGLSAPFAMSPATVLCALMIAVQDTNPIAFTLTGSIPNAIPGSQLPAVLLAGDIILPIGLSSGLDSGGNPRVCAYINGTGVVATEQESWGNVKALYR